MAYLQFESMGIPRVRTELSVSYIDHNTIQIGFENADDHRYLQSVARKYGIHLSRPGNGICHQVHLERFGRPGKTLLGSDSHTATGGGLGMVAIGAGGLDVARAMGGMPFFMNCPKVIRIELTGRLQPWVVRQGRHPGGLAELYDQGQCRLRLRIRRRRRRHPVGAGTCHHHEHGRRVRGNDLALPER